MQTRLKVDGMKSKLILKNEAPPTWLPTLIPSTFGWLFNARIRAKEHERNAIKINIKNKKITGTLKSDGGCSQKLSRRSCRIKCIGSRMGPKWIFGGGGTVECRLAEIDSRWGVTHFRHNLLLNHYIKTVMHHAVPGWLTGFVYTVSTWR